MIRDNLQTGDLVQVIDTEPTNDLATYNDFIQAHQLMDTCYSPTWVSGMDGTCGNKYRIIAKTYNKFNGSYRLATSSSAAVIGNYHYHIKWLKLVGKNCRKRKQRKQHKLKI